MSVPFIRQWMGDERSRVCCSARGQPTNSFSVRTGSSSKPESEGIIHSANISSISNPTLQQLSRKGLALITGGKRVLITEAGIDWLDDNGWSVR
jgi:hypothetical protein